jgi:hypothetical protein
MKRLCVFAVIVLVCGFVGSAKSNATNLIVNGSFGTPNVGTGWSAFTSIPGWNTNGNGIEIDNPTVFGGGSMASPGNGSDQSLEINYDYPENVYQTVNGLTVGKTYLLSWAYGDRPDSGDDATAVYFGGNLVTTNYDLLNGSNPTLLWSPNSFLVTATATSEVLSFDGLDYAGYNNNGGASYGNEIDNVSLVAVTPEPSTWLLLLSGLGLLGFGLLRRRHVLAASSAISL